LDKSMVHLAIIGCGAVTELCHLPALRYARELEVVSLVDKNIARAKFLAEKFGIGSYSDNYNQLPENIDGIIIALPHYLHAPVTIDFLNKRIPVLVEKPMALNLIEAQGMVNAAKSNNVPLQIGLMYRFCNGPSLVKRALTEGWMGRLHNFDVEWGFVYDWPIASGFFFNKTQAGGGVLMDFGSHVLDLLIWWLGAEIRGLNYRDDYMGGVEAECEISITINGPTGPVSGDITLSRLRQLDDRIRIVGEHLTIECNLYTPDIVKIWPNTSHGNELVFKIDFDTVPRQSIEQAYAEQLQSFSQTIHNGSKPAVAGEEILDSVALIDRCYRERMPLEFPWERTFSRDQSDIDL
jgi:predicted dehydrogenase